MARGRGKAPSRNRAIEIKAQNEPQSFDNATPRFCLAYLDKTFRVSNLDRDRQVAFIAALERRSSMTWGQIKLADKHGLGSELIPASQIQPSIPPRFSNLDKFMALRYHATLPMVGVRQGDTFHVLWVERAHGDVYSHG